MTIEIERRLIKPAAFTYTAPIIRQQDKKFIYENGAYRYYAYVAGGGSYYRYNPIMTVGYKIPLDYIHSSTTDVWIDENVDVSLLESKGWGDVTPYEVEGFNPPGREYIRFRLENDTITFKDKIHDYLEQSCSAFEHDVITDIEIETPADPYVDSSPIIKSVSLTHVTYSVQSNIIRNDFSNSNDGNINALFLARGVLAPSYSGQVITGVFIRGIKYSNSPISTISWEISPEYTTYPTSRYVQFII